MLKLDDVKKAQKAADDFGLEKKKVTSRCSKIERLEKSLARDAELAQKRAAKRTQSS